MTQRFVQMDLSAADFSGQRLAGAEFIQCDLTEANFTAATLAGAQFIQCDLSRATLPSYALMVATFTQCDMAGVRYVRESPSAAPAEPSKPTPKPRTRREPSSQGAARPAWSKPGDGRA